MCCEISTNSGLLDDGTTPTTTGRPSAGLIDGRAPLPALIADNCDGSIISSISSTVPSEFVTTRLRLMCVNRGTGLSFSGDGRL